MNVEEIEKRIDRAIAAPIPIDAELGGVALENMGQVMEFAKLMAVSGAAVPKYLRSNPGGCLAICSRALRWGMDPFAVAEKSYMVVNKGEERIAYEAQLVHAVITARAPLKARLRHEILGEGGERRCRVWGTFKGEETPHEYISETLDNLRAARGRNEFGVIKGSPLWDTVPEVQLAYSTVRQWCRLYASEVLLGIYTPDEVDDGSMVDVTPTPTPVEGLTKRLREAKKARAGDRGFDAAHVDREASVRNTIIEGAVNSEEEKDERDTQGSRDEPVAEGRQNDSGDRPDGDRDEGRRGEDGGADPTVLAEPAGPQNAGTPNEEDIFPPDRPKAQKGKGKR